MPSYNTKREGSFVRVTGLEPIFKGISTIPMDKHTEQLAELVKKGIVGPVTIHGEGRKLPDLSFREPVKRPSTWQRFIKWVSKLMGR